MHLSGLLIYPVKSLQGIPVSSAPLDERGLVGDRRFMVVDDNLKFLTQRELPRMALIEAELGANQLILRNPPHDSISVGLREVLNSFLRIDFKKLAIASGDAFAKAGVDWP